MKDYFQMRRPWTSEANGPTNQKAIRYWWAAFSGDAAGLRQLASADPDILPKHGYGALYAAARQDHLSATATLLDLGVSPMGPNACQQLTNVATNSDVRIFDLLVSRGADINCKTDIERRTPLMGVAATNQGMETISRAMGHTKDRDLMASARLLLAKGARVDDVDVWGGSALRISIEPNNVDIARLLLSAGADVNNYVDDSTSVGVQRGNTTLMAAISCFSLGRTVRIRFCREPMGRHPPRLPASGKKSRSQS